MKIYLLPASVKNLIIFLGLLIGLQELTQHALILIFSTYPESVLPGAYSETLVISQRLRECEARPDISGGLTSPALPESQAANSITFNIQPSDGQTHSPLTPVVTVQVLDDQGQPISGQTFNITLSLDQNPGMAALSGTLTKSTTTGTAQFDDLMLDQPGDGFSLLATLVEDTNITTISTSFNIQRSLWGVPVHYWFDANDLDGDGMAEGQTEAGQVAGKITTWANKGTGPDLTTSFTFDVNGETGTVTGNSPNLVYDTLNFNGGILFNDDLLGADINDFPTGDLSTIMAFATDSEQNDALVSYAIGSGALSNEFLVNNPTGIVAFYNNVSHYSTFDLNDGAFHLLNLFRNVLTGVSTIQADLASEQTNTGIGFQSSLQQEGVLILGQEQDELGGGFNASQDFVGLMNELVIFDRLLTPLEKQKVNSYFHIKYGRTFNNDYLAENGVVIWDLSDDPDYGYNIAAIGKASASHFHQEKAGSTNQDVMLSIQLSMGGNLPDNSFFFWSSNSEVANDNYFTALGGEVIGHLKRIWRVQEKNNQDNGSGEGTMADIGGVDLTFQIPNSFEMPVLIPRLIVDDDGTIGEGSVFSAATAEVTGDNVTFRNVNLADGDYFTLATDVLGIDHPNTTFTASPIEVVADGVDSARVELQLTWSDGSLALLSKTLEEPVLFTVTGQASIVNYGFLGGGLYRFEVVNTTAEQVLVNATLDGLQVGTPPQISFVPGPGDANNANTSMLGSHSTLEAACGFASTITLQLADQFGNKKTLGGDQVELSATGSATVSAVADNGDGSYTATIFDDVVESVTVTATVNGVVRSNTLSISFTDFLLPVNLGTNLWYRADNGTNTSQNGAAVTALNDQSHNVQNAQADVNIGVNNPTYQLDMGTVNHSVNFNPVLSFSGDQFMFIDRPDLPLGGNLRTVWLVYHDSDQSDQDGSLFNYGAYGNETLFSVGLRGINNEMFMSTFGTELSEVGEGETEFSIGEWKVNSNLASEMEFHKNGQRRTVNAIVNISDVINTTFSTREQAFIGRIFPRNHFVSGQLAELIVLCGAADAESQKKINSYLALKYGITLSGNDDGDAVSFEAEAGNFDEGDYLSSNGQIIWDGSVRQVYHHDIAGLGRDDRFGLNQKVSKSQNNDAIVTIGLDNQVSPNGLESHNLNNDGTFNNDQSFLIWGNDNAALNGSGVFEFDPNQVGTRLGREWQVSNNNFNQPVVVSFDVSELPGNPDESQFMLLLDEDSDFSEGATILSQSFVSEEDGVVNFLTNLPDNTYFTLATTEVFALLPVRLISFTAEVAEAGVQLDWSTASESANAGFRIERSHDGRSFEEIGFIPGQIDSREVSEYSFTDYTPNAGLNYYRLVDVSVGGVEHSSELLSISYQPPGFGIQVFPNPVKPGHILNVRCTGTPNQRLNWTLVNMQGKVVQHGVFITGQAIHEIKILGPWPSLTRGIYVFKISNGSDLLLSHRIVVSD